MTSESGAPAPVLVAMVKSVRRPGPEVEEHLGIIPVWAKLSVAIWAVTPSDVVCGQTQQL